MYYQNWTNRSLSAHNMQYDIQNDNSNSLQVSETQLENCFLSQLQQQSRWCGQCGNNDDATVVVMLHNGQNYKISYHLNMSKMQFLHL